MGGDGQAGRWVRLGGGVWGGIMWQVHSRNKLGGSTQEGIGQQGSCLQIVVLGPERGKYVKMLEVQFIFIFYHRFFAPCLAVSHLAII